VSVSERYEFFLGTCSNISDVSYKGPENCRLQKIKLENCLTLHSIFVGYRFLLAMFFGLTFPAVLMLCSCISLIYFMIFICYRFFVLYSISFIYFHFYFFGAHANDVECDKCSKDCLAAVPDWVLLN